MSNEIEQTDPETVTEILDGITGAYERAEQGRTEVESGDGVPIEDL